MRSLAGVLSIAFVLACGGSSQKKKTSWQPTSDAATVEDAVAMFVEMGEVVMSAEDDCDAMASAVNGWIDAHGAMRQTINAHLEQIKSPAIEQAYQEQLGQHLEVVHGMMAGVELCAGHDGFMQAWNRLD